MMSQSLQGRYFALLKAHVTRPEEKHLAAAAELGRELVLLDIPPEEIAELHEEALRRLTEEAPDILLQEVVQPTTAPLMELLMAYGLAYRERLETRRRAEEALRESEARFRDLYENAPIAYLSVGADGLIRRCNQTTLELIGCKDAGELVGRPVFDLYADTPNGKERAAGVFERFRAGGLVQSEELQMQKVDGTPVWVSVTVNAVRGADGRVVESRSMVVDITERKRTEATWQALNAGAVALQRSGLTEAEVYQAATEQMVALGLRGAVSLLDEATDSFVFEHIFLPTRLLTALEQLTGITGLGYRFPRARVPVYARVAESGQAVYIADSPALIVARLLPEPVNGLAGQIAEKIGPANSILAPLRVKDRVVGLLHVAAEQLTEVDTPAITAFADQLSSALENARLFEAERQRVAELTTLNAIAVSASQSLEIKVLLPLVCESVARLTGYEAALIYLVDEAAGEIRLHAHHGVSGEFAAAARIWQLGEGLTGQVAQSGEAIFGDYAADGRVPARARASAPSWRAFAVVPVRVHDRVVGTMNLATRARSEFTPADLKLLETITGQVGVAIENARLFEEARRRAGELSTLLEVSQALAAALRTEEALDLIISLAPATVGAEACYLFLLDETEARLVMQAVSGFPADMVGRVKYHVGEGLSGWVFAEGQAANIPDVAADPRWKAEPRQEASLVSGRIKNVLAVPLRLQDQTLGVLGMVNKIGAAAFLPADESLLTGLANQAALAIQNARLFEEARRRVEELAGLHEIARAFGALTDVRETYSALTERLARLIGARMCVVMRYDSQSGDMAAQAPGYGASDEIVTAFHYPARAARKVWDFRERGPFRANARADIPAFFDDFVEAFGVQSVLATPMQVEGRIVGLVFAANKPGGFSADDTRLMDVFAGQAGAVIENARLFEETRRRARELGLLNRVIAAAAAAHGEHEALQAGCAELARYFDVPQVALAMLDETGASETVVAEFVAPGRPPALGVQIPVAGNPAQQAVLESGRPLAVADVQTDPATAPVRSMLRERGTVSLLIVPVPVRGQVVGTLGLDSLTPREFTPEEIALAQTVGEELGRALETARLYDRLRAHAAELEKRVAERTRELAEANEQLRALNRLKDEFVSSVSHELRTPITSLKLYHDLLASQPDKREAYLARLQRETDRLELIIEDLLRLSRMDQGQVTLTLSPVDLNALVGLYVTDRQPLAEKRGVTLTFAGQPDLPTVQADQGMLGQVLSILLTNALNYTPSGGTVTVSTQSRGEGRVTGDEWRVTGDAPPATRHAPPVTRWIGFSVSDTGPGIPPEEQPRLFERFFRGRAGRESGAAGTGLGLAIAREIVERHRGRVEVASEGVPGKGATFSVWLPLKTGDG